MTAITAITARSSFGGSQKPTATIFRCGGGGGKLCHTATPARSERRAKRALGEGMTTPAPLPYPIAQTASPCGRHPPAGQKAYVADPTTLKVEVPHTQRAPVQNRFSPIHA